MLIFEFIKSEARLAKIQEWCFFECMCSIELKNEKQTNNTVKWTQYKPIYLPNTSHHLTFHLSNTRISILPNDCTSTGDETSAKVLSKYTKT